MTGEHEGRENLSKDTLNLERARKSLMEELEAVNWYQERIEATDDRELKEVLEHNRDEEKEHAAMLMEYIRKKDKVQDEKFRHHD